MKAAPIMSTAGELLDAILFVITAGLFLLIFCALVHALLGSDWDAAGAAALFAGVNGLISYCAFRRLRKSLRARKEMELKDRSPRDWKGDKLDSRKT